MRNIFSVIALLSGVVAATAQMLGVGGVEITQIGIYERKVIDSNKAVGTPTERDYNFVSNVTTVPARKGVNFGFEYRLVGVPRGLKVPIRHVVIFPGRLRTPRRWRLCRAMERRAA
jgi:hypothetical protein